MKIFVGKLYICLKESSLHQHQISYQKYWLGLIVFFGNGGKNTYPPLITLYQKYLLEISGLISSPKSENVGGYENIY